MRRQIGNIDGLTATVAADAITITATDGRNISVDTTGGALIANTGFANAAVTTEVADLTVNSTLEAAVTVVGPDGAGGCHWY